MAGHRSSSPPAADPQVAGLPITHPDRVLFDTVGITKLDLARYYDAVAPYLLPELAGRRLAMVRCPDGLHAQCFFQKHFNEAPPGVRLDGEHVLAGSRKALAALAQRGVIELHTWGSRLPRPDRPDRITLDLDPGPGMQWPQLVQAAREVRELLVAVGLRPYLKTTGGKGLHVVAPLRATRDWASVRRYAHGLALRMERRAPERYVAAMAKEKRRGRIFVDYLRNGEGATAIASFSVRARQGAPVSVPLAWEELDAGRDLSGAAFNVHNVLQRLESGTAPWKDYAADRRTLTQSMLRDMQDDSPPAD